MSEEPTIYRVSTDGDGPPEAARPLALPAPCPRCAAFAAERAEGRAFILSLQFELQAKQSKIRNQALEIGRQRRRIAQLEGAEGRRQARGQR